MRAVEDLTRAGATIVDPATVDGLDAIRRPPGMASCQGFKYDLNQFLAARKGRVPVNDLAEVVKGGKFHPTVHGGSNRRSRGRPTARARPSARRKRRIATRCARRC